MICKFLLDAESERVVLHAMMAARNVTQKQRTVIPSAVACQAVALCEGWSDPLRNLMARSRDGKPGLADFVGCVAASTPLRSGQNATRHVTRVRPTNVASPQLAGTCPSLRSSRPGNVLARLADGHFGDCFHHYPLRSCAHRSMPLRNQARDCKSRSQPARRLAHGEFHGVKVVTEKLIQSQNALLHPLQNFLRRVPLCSVTQMKRIAVARTA